MIISYTKSNMFLYKVMAKKDWEMSQKAGRLRPGAIDTDFIHLAMESQIQKVLEKFWSAGPEYVILKLDPSKFNGRLVKEKNPGGSQEYYHLYDGYIPLTAVMETLDRIN